MAGNIMEARAVITADDKTGPAFKSIEDRINGLSKQVKAIQSVGRNVSRVSGEVARVSQYVSRVNGEILSSPNSRGRAPDLNLSQRAIAGAGSLVAAAPIVRAMGREGGTYLHEKLRGVSAGMTPQEVAESEDLSARLSSKFKVFTQADVMHALRNARAVTGSFEEASSIIEPWLKLSIVARAASPHAKPEEIAEEFDSLLKGMEELGVTMDPKKFKDYIDLIAQGLNAFGDTLKPNDIFKMIQYGRQASPMLSKEFMLGIAPALGQEMRGQSFGNAVSGFNRAIVGGSMNHNAIEEMVKLGLVNTEKDANGNYKYLSVTKTGSIKGIKPGGVKGWDVAQADPFKWTHDFLQPAMVSHGITSAQEQSAILSNMFTRVVAQLVSIMLTQAPKILKNEGMVHDAMNTKSADMLLKNDLDTAETAIKTQIEQLATALSKPFLEPATKVLNILSDGLSAMALRAEHDKPFAVAGTAAAVSGAALAGLTAMRMGYGLWQTGSMSEVIPILARAGVTGGALGAAIGGGYLFAEGVSQTEAITKAARERMYSDPNWTPHTEAEMAQLRADLATVEGELAAARITGVGGAASGSPVGSTDLLEALAQTLRSRIARGESGVIGADHPSFGFGPGGSPLPKVGGVPMPSSGDKPNALEAIVKPDQITAKLEGQADVNISFRVEPSSEFLRIVQGARDVASTGNVRANVGASMPEASTAGRTGVSPP